jgi:hypothetical protein
MRKTSTTYKAFYIGFWDGFHKGSIVGLPIAFGLIVGWAFAMYFHPYEICKRKYETLEDISECMWILEHD